MKFPSNPWAALLAHWGWVRIEAAEAVIECERRIHNALMMLAEDEVARLAREKAAAEAAPAVTPTPEG